MSLLTAIRFVSSNAYKIAEATAILATVGVTVIPVTRKVEELQSLDEERLVRDKLLRAFKMIGRPLFVEHTGLRLTRLNGFPGGLTQIFWDTLEADLFSSLFGSQANECGVVARTTVAYCNGKSIHSFHGECRGTIVSPPRGPKGFQWDCVFQPEGHTQTFAELGETKNQLSMRKQALDQLAVFIASGGAK